MFKGRIGRTLLAIAVSGIGVLGMSSPASADETPVSFKEYCGYVELTIDGNEDSVRVYRNGVAVGKTYSEKSYWGATPGDVITVEGSEESWTYENPEQCETPEARIKFYDGCQGLVKLVVDNSGPGAMTGFIFQGGSVPPGSHVDLDSLSFSVGVTTLEISVEGGYRLYQEGDGFDIVWYKGYYEESEECDPNNVEVTFTDSCNKVKVEATSGLERLQKLVIVKNEEVIDIAYLHDGMLFSKEYDAVAGDEFEVYYPEPETDIELAMSTREMPEEDLVLIAEHTHVGQQCELPVTGAKTTTMVLVGLLLLVFGTGLVLAPRMRWIAQA